MTAEKTSSERYRELIAKEKPAGGDVETIDVEVPSGFVFKFRKPSKYALLFSTNRLPAFASAAAAASGKNGGGFDQLTTGQKDEMTRAAFNVRDRVCELSVDPKIVIGPAAEGTNELSANDIAPDDLTYLFEWTAAGGDAGLMLAQFRNRPGPSPLASASRPKQRRPPVRDAIAGG
jgi:hypothetical protein